MAKKHAILLLSLLVVFGALTGILLDRGYIVLSHPEDSASTVIMARDPALSRAMLVWENDGKICLTRLQDNAQLLVTDGRNPRWSPDGQSIVFTRGNDVWLMHRAGRKPVQVYSGVVTEYGTGAYWTPDGKRLVMILKKNPRQVVTLSLQTGKINVIHDEGKAPFRGYELSQCAELRCNDRYLLTFTTDAGHRSMIVDLVGRQYITNRYMREGDCGPSWSPDGRFIIMTRRVRASRKRPLYITFFDAAQGTLSDSEFFIGGGWCHSASISNDSRYVVYVSGGNILLCPVEAVQNGVRQAFRLTATGRGDGPALFIFPDTASMWQILDVDG